MTLREGWMLNPALETQTEAARRAYLDQRLRETANTGLDGLADLPIIRKDNLAKMQAESPPFAGLLKGPVSRLRRMFASPGPTFVPQGGAVDYWRFGMAFAACGIKAGDVVMNTLSYHLTPGGFMLDSGLRSLGCVVIPAGTGQTDLQVKVASALKATGYAGTPSFLRTLLLHAREAQLELHF
jgi:phenylacetate-CoA ligase